MEEEKQSQNFTVTGTEETFSEKKHRDDEALRDVFPEDTSLKDVNPKEEVREEKGLLAKLKNFLTI
ncbi:MAG: hypothetical protein QG653_291 [Patescibacteria group bacterium]|nr:hypothetical protein [Patescibacteria group bacterium]